MRKSRVETEDENGVGRGRSLNVAGMEILKPEKFSQSPVFYSNHAKGTSGTLNHTHKSQVLVSTLQTSVDWLCGVTHRLSDERPS